MAILYDPWTDEEFSELGKKILKDMDDDEQITKSVTSLKVASHEIIKMSKNIDVVKVNIVGDAGSGKTILAKTLAYLLQEESKDQFNVKYLTRTDILNISKTIASFQATNHILIFDDISFIYTTEYEKKIKQIEQAFTEIRHLPGGQDIKIIAIFNFHYTLTASKYLRQSNAHFYTTIGPSDKDNVVDIVGKAHLDEINSFIQIKNECNAASKYTSVFRKQW